MRGTRRLPLLAAWLTAVAAFAAYPAAAQRDTLRFERLTTEDGLSQGTVNAILQDRRGLIWIATDDGLNRFDGYQFRVFRNDPSDPASLSENVVNAVVETRDGALWVATLNGLDRFDPTSERFTRFHHDPASPASLPHDEVWSVYEDAAGGLWIGTNGGLALLDRAAGRFTTFRHAPGDASSLPHDEVRAIAGGGDGTLWIGTYGGGLARFDPGTGRAERLAPPGAPADGGLRVVSVWVDAAGEVLAGALGGTFFRYRPGDGSFAAYGDAVATDAVRSVVDAGDGTLWLATTDGLCRFDPAAERCRAVYRHDPLDPHSVSYSNCRSLFRDRTGLLWIGTQSAGISLLNPRAEVFRSYRHDPDDLASLATNNVRSILPAADGTVWVGTSKGLDRLDRARGTVTHYQHDPDRPAGLLRGPVKALYEDRDGYLWIGHYLFDGGVSRLDPRTGELTHFQHDPEDPKSLASNAVKSIFEDAAGALWIGTFGGLDRLDRTTGSFEHFRHDPDDPESLSHDRISPLADAGDGALWVGTTGAGLNRFEPATGRAVRYQHDAAVAASLSHDEVMSLLVGRDGTVWVGTYGGLNRFDPEASDPDAGTFTRFRASDGLPDDAVYALLEDAAGHLWLSTNHGLCRFDPASSSCDAFYARDGLQDDQFNEGAAGRSAAGELFFGGVAGLTAFYPDRIRRNDVPPPVVLTDFRVLNRSVAPGAGAALERAAPYAEHVALGYRDNVFSFEFAALDYADPRRNRYAYRLEGFDEDWVPTDAGHRVATYTNLDPGEYVFRVRASNKDGVWNEDGARVALFLAAPPWRTRWAYSLYFFAFALLLLLAVRAQQRQLAYERSVTRRLRELDRIKDEFLANTSHELRTPLMGIVGLAESLTDGVAGELPGKVERNLELIVASGRRLSNLVGDLLDLTKLRHRSLELSPGPVDLYSMTDVVLSLLRPLVAGRDLALRNAIPLDLPTVRADENRLQQVLYNLVGNAVKFTEQGSVAVSAERVGEAVAVEVADTGIGIPPDKLERIFEPFEQAEGAVDRRYGGTGLGLAISRQLIELHGGELTVRSTPGEGATFRFTLPVYLGLAIEPSAGSEELARPQVFVDGAAEAPALIPDGALPAGTGHHVLIVDDELVNRQVLMDQLSLYGFRLSQAPSGVEAVRIVEGEDRVDLMLLDVMMPRMSGYEVCRRLRERWRASELPVILLTARDQVADLVAGFAAGANDYLRKPFSKQELLARVSTQLDLLDATRLLESRVAERSQELAAKNDELERVNRRLEELTLTDPLTELGNRRFLVRLLEQETARIARIYRDGTGSSPWSADLIFLLLDLDRFKQINDAHGHAAGDRVLKQIKPLLEWVSRSGDLLVRWGGEEFVIVLRDSNRARAPAVAERLREAVARHRFAIGNGQTLGLTVSIGFACYPFVPDAPEQLNWEQVLSLADRALLAAKRSGRDAWVGFSTTAAAAGRRDLFELIQESPERALDAGVIEAVTSLDSTAQIVWE